MMRGDIRPAPMLLPAPFGDRSRIRSDWVDVGSGVIRLPVSQHGAVGPRRILENSGENLLAGPRFLFDGTNDGTNPTKVDWVGYIDYEQTTPPGGIDLSFATVLPTPAAISVIDAGAAFEGRPAYRVSLVNTVLGTVADRYSQYQAELADINGTVQGSYRIVGHDGRNLWLSPDQGALPQNLTGLNLQVVARFFDVTTNDSAGLGPTYKGGVGRVPVANLRIGFAFHKDPSKPALQGGGLDLNRLPSDPTQFLYDLSDPTVQEAVRQFAGATSESGARFMKWDVLFNIRFSEDPGNTNGATVVSPSSPRPALNFLVVPYRY